MALHDGMKLGRLPTKYLANMPSLRDMLPHVGFSDSPANTEVDWSRDVTGYPMMLNDQISDCTIAGVGHAIQTWGSYEGGELIMQDADALAAYKKVSGYNPADPRTDRGAYMVDVLKEWSTNGFAIGQYRHVLDGFCSVPLDKPSISKVIEATAGCYVGLTLRKRNMDQEIFDYVSPADTEGYQIIGGHCIYFYGCDNGYIRGATWGQRKYATWAFLQQAMDEAYALFSRSWVNANGVNPEGWNWGTIVSMCQTLGQ